MTFRRPLVALGLLAVSAGLPAQTLPPPVANAAAWKPAPGLRWQVQYEGAIDTGVDADAFMLDLVDADERTIALLRQRGKRLVCYVNAGAWENWRPDVGRFPPQVLGRQMAGWPGERWLDVRQVEVLMPIMAARLDLCAARGYDGVIFDNVNSYINDTGFPLTAADQLRYSALLANAARTRGLAAGVNNDARHAALLEPYFDWAQAESCFVQGWCADLRPFTARGKAVVAIEYSDTRFDRRRACAHAAALGIDLLVKNRRLDAARATCPATKR